MTARPSLNRAAHPPGGSRRFGYGERGGRAIRRTRPPLVVGLSRAGTAVVISALAVVVIAAGLLLAAWAGIWTLRRLPTNDALMIGAIVLEVLLTVQTVIAVIRVGGAGLLEPVTFVAYAVGVLLPLPLGFYLARIERTRWGSLSLGFTALVTAVMTLRLLQIWRNAGV